VAFSGNRTWHSSPGQQRDAIANSGGANLVIALDRADEGNGGFEVLSGTHLGGAPREMTIA
jgi:hypothetical protein